MRPPTDILLQIADSSGLVAVPGRGVVIGGFRVQVVISSDICSRLPGL